MLLRDIYKSNIDRDINGVIKVAQDDEASIRQELEEYIITRELRRHFATFLNNYEHSLDVPTDKIGVWLSGFFGSGKSHLLKILSMLLSNKVVGGKHAVDYFSDKFDDPMMFAQLERCASVPTDTILFNIDSKSPLNKDATAILRVFARVFYDHQGFYGSDLRVAKLEQFISKQGKLDAFKEEFENINGAPWEETRDAMAFWEDDVVDALQNVLGISETAARNWFNGSETVDLTIEQLVSEIRDYINSKGKNYRLLFMVDEVGQYIGSDGSLMLNLQTIVEEIGSRCGGRVWVLVTSQEAIDSITKISGDDFSKIQGRFNTRLSLSSSSVDEVIKRRILAKTDLADKMLAMKYGTSSAVLRNLYTFNGAVLDLKGYESEYDFVETYPFVPYQFRLMQNVLAQIRKHGNSGKHLSGGERSMLSGFQEAAQAIEERDENALVPFHLFYNTVHTFLEGSIRRVIDRCQTAADNHDGIEDYDVSILKLLYLIRYVDDIKANVDNITTLMIDDIRADKINMRAAVQASLDRLISQNYIARNGDTYAFLTDDEQDIWREIRQTVVNSADITQKIAETVYGDLYISKKYKYDKYDFSYDQMIDETVIGSLTGSMKLRLLTVASEVYNGGDQLLIMKSLENTAILRLSDEYPYFEEIENAMKIRKYVKGRNVAQLPEAIQAIIRGCQQQASAYEKRAKELISQAITASRVYIHGEHVDIRGGSVKEKIDNAMRYLVESVYAKLSLVRKHYDTDMDILNVFSPDKQLSMAGVARPNLDAIREIKLFLEMQEMKHLPTTMGDVQRRFTGIPYGWREADIAGVIAEMIAEKIEDLQLNIRYSGSVIPGTDRKIVDYLRKKTEIDKAVVEKKVSVSGAIIDRSRKFLREYLNVMDVPADEEGLVAFVITSFTDQKAQYENLIAQYNAGKYPEKNIVEDGIARLNKLFAQRRDNTALLSQMLKMEDELLDLSEDIADVLAFFKNQRVIFDSAQTLLQSMAREKSYLEADDELLAKLREMQTILSMPKPYKRIQDLPTLMQAVQTSYGRMLDAKRADVAMEVQSAMAELHQAAEDAINQGMDRDKAKNTLTKGDTALTAKRDAVQKAQDLTSLDAMYPQIQSIKQQYLTALVYAPDPKVDIVTANRASLCYAAQLKNQADIDDYVETLRKKLNGMLQGHDILHII